MTSGDSLAPVDKALRVAMAASTRDAVAWAAASPAASRSIDTTKSYTAVRRSESSEQLVVDVALCCSNDGGRVMRRDAAAGASPLARGCSRSRVGGRGDVLVLTGAAALTADLGVPLRRSPYCRRSAFYPHYR